MNSDAVSPRSLSFFCRNMRHIPHPLPSLPPLGGDCLLDVPVGPGRGLKMLYVIAVVGKKFMNLLFKVVFKGVLRV